MRAPRLLSRICRGIRKPPHIIAFKVRQESALATMRYTGEWSRLARAITSWWEARRVARFAAGRAATAVIAPDAPRTLRVAADRGMIASKALADYAQGLRNRRFRLLGADVPPSGPWPWHTDWRFGHTWRPAYFRTYNFYHRSRTTSYDVKIPWELSRMAFLAPMLQRAALNGDGGWIEAVLEVVADWEQSNPLAYAVSWCAMEASMRGINLVLALEMILALPRYSGQSPIDPAPLLRLISSHGEFIWRTREYTDIRGNHYAANVVALALCGLVLRGWYPQAERWVVFAKKAIEVEIKLQFLADGVNFEKSVAYHRLVTELFLMGAIALERSGAPIGPQAKQRLRQACHYTAGCIRPDGLTPNVGDNDDARVLNFDPVPLRDHRPLLGVAAGFWCDPELKATAGAMPAALVWLLGASGLAAWRSLADTPLPDKRRYFAAGGVVAVRERGSFLWMDVGELGLAGRGGHDHNDLLSFELVLRGHPLIVDPGSFVYTGDARARNLFRATRYHNGLAVDGAEIAPLRGMWEIGNHAQPQNVRARITGQAVIIRAGHSGYRRLADPVDHTRELRFDPTREILECLDRLESKTDHTVERFLHFHPDIDVVLEKNEVIVSSGASRWTIRVDKGAELRCEPGWVSPGYGVRTEAMVVTLTNHIRGDAELHLVIQPYATAGRGIG